MKKLLLSIVGLGLFVHLYSAELSSASLDSSWRLERTNFYFENDIFAKTDNQYSAGWKLSNVYFVPSEDTNFLKIPFFYETNKTKFVSLGVTLQIYTPNDLNSSKLIVNDRPYAGWFYFEIGTHQSSKTELDSLILQVGIVGKYSGGEVTQRTLHQILGNETPKGWSNQLHNEFGMNLIYQHKWRYVPQIFLGMKSSIIPFISASLGNVSSEISGGALMRFGWNPIADFGSSSIDVGGENGIPIDTNCFCPKDKQWSFTFNLSTSAQAIAHDIFLDGNTFTKSHSVEKEKFIFYSAYGFTLRYNYFVMEYTNTATTKHFHEEASGHNYGTLLFSYLY